jgi:hypothetical protein
MEAERRAAAEREAKRQDAHATSEGRGGRSTKVMVRCPPGATAGTKVAVQVENIGRIKARVPEGIDPGECFQIEISPEVVARVKARERNKARSAVAEREAARRGELEALRAEQNEQQRQLRRQLREVQRRAAEQGQMIVKVRCPDEVGPGMMLSIKHPKNGASYRVRVPDGVEPGSIFHAMVEKQPSG